MGVRDQVRDRFIVTVGDGQNTFTWEDNWLPTGPFSNNIAFQYLCINDLHETSTVHDMIYVVGNSWPME